MKWSLLALVAIACLIYGFALGRYEVPPFKLLESLVQNDARAVQLPSNGFASDDAQWKPTVIMMGDSLSGSFNWGGFFGDLRIAPRAVAGATSLEGLNNVDLIVGQKPRVVLIMFGINDAIRGWEPKETAANVLAIASELREAGISAYVQSVLYAKIHPAVNERVSAVNDILRADPEFIDLIPCMTESGKLRADFTWDGVHLTESAYLAWANAIRPLVVDPNASSAPREKARLERRGYC